MLKSSDTILTKNNIDIKIGDGHFGPSPYFISHRYIVYQLPPPPPPEPPPANPPPPPEEV